MVFEIEVNNKTIQAKKGETILAALTRHGIKVPTLCRMKDFSPTGACRMCVVEVEGKKSLVTACSHPVEEWMKIKTHSQRVIKSRRTIVELLLSNHPDDCLYCDRNGQCELQDLAIELNIRERRIKGKKSRHKLDKSSPSIVRDPAKCILCGRCVRVCEEQQKVATIDFINRGHELFIGTAFNKGMNFSSCIACGQCIMVCPTGALHEKTYFDEIQEALHNPKLKTVIQYGPSVTVSLAEEFGVRPGKDLNGVINTALRKIGFDYIFDSTFGADMAIMEAAAEFLQRFNQGENLPMFTSCCPAWVKYAEQFRPDILPHLSTVKSPQQLVGTMIKTWFAEKNSIKSDEIYSVSIMPCIAKKFEAQREEMSQKGIQDVDAVITTRELARLIRLFGIDMNNIEDEVPNQPMGTRSSAGKIFGASGGVTEGILRTAHFLETGKEISNLKMTKIRGLQERKETRVKIGKKDIGVLVLGGLKEVKTYLEEFDNGMSDFQLIEVMACPGGCINGGGQPLHQDDKALKARMKALYDIDDKESIKVAHKNPRVNELYDEFFGDPLCDKCMSLMHTKFTKRDVLL